MIIEFELCDQEDEPIMTMKGFEYIPSIGSSVYFNDCVENENGECIGIDFNSIVESHNYNVESNTLCIYCKIDKLFCDLHEYTQENIRKYNKIKYDTKK